MNEGKKGRFELSVKSYVQNKSYRQKAREGQCELAKAAIKIDIQTDLEN